MDDPVTEPTHPQIVSTMAIPAYMVPVNGGDILVRKLMQLSISHIWYVLYRMLHREIQMLT